MKTAGTCMLNCVLMLCHKSPVCSVASLASNSASIAEVHQRVKKHAEGLGAFHWHLGSSITGTSMTSSSISPSIPELAKYTSALIIALFLEQHL